MENPQPTISTNVGYSSEGDVAKLFVGQIPKNFTEQQVKELMEPFGAIGELSIIKDKETMCSRGKLKASKQVDSALYCLPGF